MIEVNSWTKKMALEELAEMMNLLDDANVTHVRRAPSAEGEMCAIYTYSDEQWENDGLYQLLTEPLALRSFAWALNLYGETVILEVMPGGHDPSIESGIIHANDNSTTMTKATLRSANLRAQEMIEDLDA